MTRCLNPLWLLASATLMAIGCSKAAANSNLADASAASTSFQCRNEAKYAAQFDKIFPGSNYASQSKDVKAQQIAQVGVFNQVVEAVQSTDARDPQDLSQFLFGSVQERGTTYQFVAWIDDYRYNPDVPTAQVVFFVPDTTQAVGFLATDSDSDRHFCYGKKKLDAKLAQ